MNYFKKEIAVFVATLIAIVCLVYMDKIWAALSWDAETFIAISAMMSVVVAIIALVVSWRADKRNEKHVRLSASPIITGQSFDNNVPNRPDMRHIGFQIVNRGNNLAVIKSIALFFDDKEVARDNSQTYLNFIKTKTQDFKEVTLGFLVPNTILGIGEVRTMWELKYKIGADNIDEFIKLDLRVEYKSIYEEKLHIYDTRDNRKFHEI